MRTSALSLSSQVVTDQQPVVSQIRWLARRMVAGLAVMVCCYCLAVPAWGAVEAGKTEETTQSETEKPERPPIPTLDLGKIEIKNAEPSHSHTTEMSFQVHLAFSQDTPPATIDALEHMQHRLREQVIVAVRTAELADFLDPQLERFRRRILFRVNRLLKEVQVTDVLLANFTFSAG